MTPQSSFRPQTLTYLAEVMVNGTDIAGLQGTPGPVPAPLPAVSGTPPRGYKQVIVPKLALGNQQLPTPPFVSSSI